MLELKQEGLGIFLTWMVLGLVFFYHLYYATNKMMWSTIHLSFSTLSCFFFFSFMISFFGHGGSLFCQFDFVMLYSIVSWTMYIVHTYERFSIFLFSLASMHQSDIFSLLATIVVIFFFCVFVTFQLLCSNQKICLQFCPIKSPHHEMPRKSLKSDALLQISSHAPSGESLSDFASVFLKLSYHLLWH